MIKRITVYTVLNGVDIGSFLVQRIMSEGNNKAFLVHDDLSAETYDCVCKKFQRDSMLCGHILRVIIQLNVYVIPEKYMFHRWTLRGCEHSLVPLKARNIDETSSRKLRYMRVCKRSVAVAAEAYKTKQGYGLAVKTISDLAVKLEEMNLTLQAVVEPTSVNTTIVADSSKGHSMAESSIATVKDPKKKVSRGRPKKSTRLKSSVHDAGGSAKKKKLSTSNQ